MFKKYIFQQTEIIHGCSYPFGEIRAVIAEDLEEAIDALPETIEGTNWAFMHIEEVGQ